MSDVLDFFRTREPRFKDVPDDELTGFIGKQYPDFLKDEGFKKTFDDIGFEEPLKTERMEQAPEQRFDFSAQNPDEGFERPITPEEEQRLVTPLVVPQPSWREDVRDTFQQNVRDPLGLPTRLITAAGKATGVLSPDAPELPTIPEAAGGTLKLASDAAAGAVSRLVRGEGPGEIITQFGKGPEQLPAGDKESLLNVIPTEMARLAPALAATGGLGALGVPAPLAFGAPFAALTYGETGDPIAAMQSGGIAAVIPGVGGAGRAGGELMAQRAAAALRTGPVATRALEATGRLVGSQALMGGLLTATAAPEMVHLLKTDPEGYQRELTKIVAMNLAFEVPHLPANVRQVMAKDRVDQYTSSPEYKRNIDNMLATQQPPSGLGETARVVQKSARILPEASRTLAQVAVEQPKVEPVPVPKVEAVVEAVEPTTKPDQVSSDLVVPEIKAPDVVPVTEPVVPVPERVVPVASEPVPVAETKPPTPATPASSPVTVPDVKGEMKPVELMTKDERMDRYFALTDDAKALQSPKEIVEATGYSLEEMFGKDLSDFREYLDVAMDLGRPVNAESIDFLNMQERAAGYRYTKQGDVYKSAPPSPPIAEPRTSPPVAETVAQPAAAKVATPAAVEAKVQKESSIEAFTAAMSPMQRGKSKSALDKAVQNKGKPWKLSELVDDRVSNGATVERTTEVNESAREKLQREFDRTRGNYPIGNQKHPETIRFNEVKSILESGGPMTEVRRLVNSDESFLSEKAIGKIAMDYAEHLIGSKKSPTPKPAATEGIDTGALGEVGMGGAKPGEFVPSGATITGIKNARIDQQRAERGLEPIPKPETLTDKQVHAETMAKIDADPGWQDRVISELTDTPRAMTPVETVGMLHRITDLRNEHAKTTRELAEAYDEGRTEDVSRLNSIASDFGDQLSHLESITGRGGAGTESGRSLRWRRTLMADDFSLAQMEANKRAAKGGAPLTPQERVELVKAQAKIEATQKAYDDYVARTDQRLSVLEVAKAVSDLQRDNLPRIHPKILEQAEKIVQKFESAANAAGARLREKLKTASSGVDPTILSDLIIIGIGKLARKELEFAKWADEMVVDWGETIRPYLDDAWKASNAMIESTAQKAPRAVGDTVRKISKGETPEQKQVALKETISARIKEGDTAHLTPLVQKLARSFVEQGIRDREALIDAVHSVLKETNPELTRREAMDAISGYGDYKQLSKDQVSVELRGMKGEMQQLAKLEDITSRQPPLKTGVERRTPTDEERRLLKLVNEAKRKYGVVVTDPARQLKSALDSVKTRLKNQIADLEFQIASDEKIVKKKTGLQYDTEANTLKAERDALKTQFDELFGKPEMTDEQRVRMAIGAVERSITDLEQRIKTNDIGPRSRASKTPNTPELESARARRDALKAELEEMRELANPKKTPEEIALQSLKTRLKNRTAELQAKLLAGDFAPRTKRTTTLDAEANRLKFENENAKRAYYEGLFNDRMARRSVPAKLLGTGAEILNTSRAVLTSADFSAVLRQGGFIAFAHPILAAKSLPAMFKAFRSERNQHAVDQEILSRENYPLYKASKLYLSERGHDLSKMEEAYMSRWAYKIPLVAGSQRAYTTFLNKLRADSFDLMAKSLSKDGTMTPDQAKALSNFINVATGRGTFGAKDQVAVGLNTVFFAPRYVASRFQLLLGQPLMRGDAKTRKLIAKEYARFLIGIGAVYGLGALAGADFEWDPRSSNFGKMRFGNTRIDPLAGLAQVTTLLGRLISGETKTGRGEIKPIRGDKVRAGQGAVDFLWRFIRSKLSPAVGMGVDVVDGKDVVGQKVTPGSMIQKTMMPISFQGIYDAMKDMGVPKGAAVGLLSIFGMGVQTYDDNNAPQKPKQQWGGRVSD